MKQGMTVGKVKAQLHTLDIEQKSLFILIISYSEIVCHSKVQLAIFLPMACKTKFEPECINQYMKLFLCLHWGMKCKVTKTRVLMSSDPDSSPFCLFVTFSKLNNIVEPPHL